MNRYIFRTGRSSYQDALAAAAALRGMQADGGVLNLSPACVRDADVNQPFGRVLQAIRENDVRADALGYRTVYYRAAATCLAAAMAILAGALNALWLRYTGPDTTLSFTIMLDILLMAVIGGMGTIYGAGGRRELVHHRPELPAEADGERGEGDRRWPLLPSLLHPRPLAAMARRSCSCQRLFLPRGHRRQAQAEGGGNKI